jgi:hypothetical protein
VVQFFKFELVVFRMFHISNGSSKYKIKAGNIVPETFEIERKFVGEIIGYKFVVIIFPPSSVAKPRKEVRLKLKSLPGDARPFIVKFFHIGASPKTIPPYNLKPVVPIGVLKL